MVMCLRRAQDGGKMLNKQTKNSAQRETELWQTLRKVAAEAAELSAELSQRSVLQTA